MKYSLLLLLCLVVTGCTNGADVADESPQNATILVTGATGSQGGAVARELLGRGFDVRGLTRNPDSERARALAALGATMVQGDFDDFDSLVAAMQGASGVFAMTDFWEHGYEREVQHGKNLISAAGAAGVGHFVYSSVAGAADRTGLPHFDSKGVVEGYLAQSGIPYTVVRPVEFMDNVRWAQEMILGGQYDDPRGPDSSHQWIAVSDIGFFVGEAFSNPEAWQGRTLDIAGDELTVGEYIELLSTVSGVEVEHLRPSWEEYEEQAGEEMALMMRWFDESGYDVDVTALRAQYPNLLTQEQYLRSLDWSASDSR